MFADTARSLAALPPGLAAVLQDDEWDDSEAARSLAAWDVLHAGVAPLGVLRPATVGALAQALPLLTGAGVAIVPRGGGTSYSAGAIAETSRSVVVDLTRLDAVREISVEDRVVRVQAGCSWERLLSALLIHGQRTPCWGPASGRIATVGGAIAQDAMFYGSATHGTVRQSVLGLSVLLADGGLLHTGIHGEAQRAALPTGCDATGLFVGSCGALGIVVEASLRLTDLPPGAACVGFECPDLASGLRALTSLPATSGLAEAVLAYVPPASNEQSFLSISLESPGEVELERGLSRVLDACELAGLRHAGEGLLPAWRKQPFPALSMLQSEQGQRWIPVHGVLPTSRAEAAVAGLTGFLEGRGTALAEHEMSWNLVCVRLGPGAILVEVNLHWRGEGNPRVRELLGVQSCASTESHAGQSSPDVAAVIDLRAELADRLAAAGAVHLQLGRRYEYLPRLEPTQRRLLAGLKSHLDPRGLMNPGVLGLETSVEGSA